MPTVIAKDRFALVEPTKGRSGMDIRFRMLQPHELAAAMGFTDYEFAGNKTEKVRQIGNAVPVNTAKALVKAILAA
jgi:DNA (cytosine-5)-methyltransferase 1